MAPIIFSTLNVACAARSCVSDHKHRIIPNNICKLLILINLIAACYYGYIFQSAITTLIIFLVLTFIWLIGGIGAGDIKLLCAFAVGIKPELTIVCLVMIGFLGGGQLIITYLIGFLMNKSLFEKGIPYGIPISIGGVVFTALSFLSY